MAVEWASAQRQAPGDTHKSRVDSVLRTTKRFNIEAQVLTVRPGYDAE